MMLSDVSHTFCQLNNCGHIPSCCGVHVWKLLWANL